MVFFAVPAPNIWRILYFNDQVLSTKFTHADFLRLRNYGTCLDWKAVRWLRPVIAETRALSLATPYEICGG
jgi:hypothetical protein